MPTKKNVCLVVYGVLIGALATLILAQQQQDTTQLDLAGPPWTITAKAL